MTCFFRMPWISLLLFLLLGLFQAAHAQEAPAMPTIADLQAQLENKDKVIADLIGQMSGGPLFSPEQAKTITDARAAALAGYYISQLSYNQNGDRLREHQQRVFSWQMTAANWLLLVVVIVSLSGVVFAGYEMISARNIIARDIEYRHAIAENARTMTQPIAAVPPAQQADGENPEGVAAPEPAPAVQGAASANIQQPAFTLPANTILIQPDKIHITSAVIGIVILSLSLGFLYLFLREVYAIDVIQITDTGRTNVIHTRNAGEKPRQEPPAPPPAETE